MKKILTIAVASLAIAAVADSYSPQIGVTKLSLSNKNNILPVQFTSLTNGNVTADALVCTNNIPEGSYLLAYIGNLDNPYSVWVLGSNGWVSTDVVSVDGVSVTAGAANTELAVGSAIWLSFSAKPASAINVSVYGKVTTSPSVSIAAGTTSLVCNPTSSAKVPTLSGLPAYKDKVVVITDTNSGEYVYTGTKWLHRDTSGKVTDSELPEIPAHGGFWYISNGGVSGTISW